MNKIPTYEVVFTDECEFQMISIVDEPAIEVQFIAFSEDKIKLSIDNEKMILMGPVLIPDIKIFRNTLKNTPECNIVFTKDTIEKMFNKFSKQGLVANLNVNHSEQTVSSYMLESWLVEDSLKDKSAIKGYELPVGTWMASVKIEDEKFWKEQVKTGNVKGFSIEAFISLGKLMQSSLKKQAKIIKKSMKKVILEKEAISSYGGMLYTETEWVKGANVYYKDEDGGQYPAGDGLTIVEIDGTKYVISISFGKIEEILKTVSGEESTEETNQNKNKMNNTNLEKDTKLQDGTVVYTTGDDFVEGAEVYSDAEYKTYVEDKEWLLEDGRTIVTEGGKIVKIIEKVDQVTEEDEEKVAEEEVKAEIDPAVQVMIDDYNAFKEEIRKVIGELSSKIDSLSNPEVDVVEEFKKINASIDKLSSQPGGKSMTATVVTKTNQSTDKRNIDPEAEVIAKLKKIQEMRSSK